MIGLLEHWLPEQRWFAGRGRERGPIRVVSRTPVAKVRGDAEVELVLLEIDISVGGTPTVQRYQLWLGWHPWLPQILDHARIGSAGNWTAYDALHDSEVSALLLQHLAAGAVVGDLRFEPEPGTVIDTTAPGLPIGAEQSNTSIVYGQSSILKMFRRLEPGPNPDAEVHRALHAIGGKHVATPLGTLTGIVDGVDTTLGVLMTFFAGSAEGWAMATTSVRDLMAEGDLRADEVGGDFAAESLRLGKAVAEVHADLATAFGTAELTDAERAHLAAGMAESAKATALLVPEVEAALEPVLETFARFAADPTPLTVQRIHGDLHLGQTLRVLVGGWAILDFEGEPAKPLAYRRALYSPLKDIAGMLRSFDYAAHHSLVGRAPDGQHQYRATEWARRNRAAFCEGYASVAGSDPRDHPAVLAAFELDKAVYEVAYEYGHRPAWVPIPLQAINRLITSNGGRS
ncbi:aminoglycoside phosphotransferase [Nakamurella sp. YIM 132087]|uniref:Maltokinase n=1 Tax=Nakamurella alba TaxID=2665158 RepID=A0A7K1FTK6_9ACTN|nr:aminoglycoside phosphotransferase [Nakamurella alba]